MRTASSFYGALSICDYEARVQLTAVLDAPSIQGHITAFLQDAHEAWRPQPPPGMKIIFDHPRETLSAAVIVGHVLQHDDPPARQVALVFNHETSPYFFRPDVQRWVSLALVRLPEL
jgi:hypothetical protein